MANKEWTAEEDKLLKELLESGLPFSAAAARIGRTKNAAISRSRKLGVKSVHPCGGKIMPKPGRVCENWSAAWTEDDIEALRSHRRAGLSIREIALRMGRTYAAIQHATAKHSAPLPEAKRLKYATKERAPADVVSLLAGQLVAFADLEPHHCRWPFGDSNFSFCGADRQQGSAYCPVHHGLAWNGRRATPQERRRAEISMRQKLVGSVR